MQGKCNEGIVCYRVDIANPTATGLSVGAVLTAGRSCDLPISQMDLVKDVDSLVDFQLMEQRD
jgi:hypothetical protein